MAEDAQNTASKASETAATTVARPEESSSVAVAVDSKGADASEAAKAPEKGEPAQKDKDAADAKPADTKEAEGADGGEKRDATEESPAAAPAADSNPKAEAAPAASATPASTKKKGGASRRKSAVDLKKGTPKKVVEDKEFKPGQYVAARMKGYPSWPAIILSEDVLPAVLQKGPTQGKGRHTVQGDQWPSAWKTQYPILWLGSYDYSWSSIADLDPLNDAAIEAGPTRKKSKALIAAFEDVKGGFDLDDAKKLQSGTLQVEAPDEDEDAMDVDEEEEEEEPSEEERPKKRAGKKRKKSESASDDEEEPEKPAKTPKKASTKAKPPKSSAAKTPKTPKTPTNGVKNAAKAKPTPTKKTPVAKPSPATTGKKGRGSTKKGVEATENSESEGEIAKETEEKKEFLSDPTNLRPEQQEEVMMHRRHKLQKVFLNKDDIPPPAKDMPLMARYLDSLEKWPNIQPHVIRNTKIHKVLKGIYKYKKEIPDDSKYNFRNRCQKLYENWSAILANNPASTARDNERVTESASAKEKENGVHGRVINGDAAMDIDAKEAEAKDSSKDLKDVVVPDSAKEGDKGNATSEVKT